MEVGRGRAALLLVFTVLCGHVPAIAPVLPSPTLRDWALCTGSQPSLSSAGLSSASQPHLLDPHWLWEGSWHQGPAPPADLTWPGRWNRSGSQALVSMAPKWCPDHCSHSPCPFASSSWGEEGVHGGFDLHDPSQLLQTLAVKQGCHHYSSTRLAGGRDGLPSLGGVFL